MNFIKRHTIIFSLILLSMLNGCVEPFQVEQQNFEGILVVDARLTNEEKQHQVFLSRAIPFQQDTIDPVQNARVEVIEDLVNTYTFVEIAPGHYSSELSFKANANHTYQLKITTANGSSFSSASEKMPENIPLAKLQARRTTNNIGEDGVAILVSNESTQGQPSFFRYDYEESYKIKAPNWDPFKFVIIDSIACSDGDGYEVIIEAKNSTKGRICYGSNKSRKIMLASTADLDENIISDLELRFINRENFILSQRYSILVNQYTQSNDAHAFYEGLKEFSSSDNAFSNVQPGFLEGNMFSNSNDEDKVIGFFETAAVSSKRIFFNYKDLFPDEELPPYPSICSILGNPSLIAPGYHCSLPPNSVCDGNCQSPLISQIQTGLIVFAAEKEPIDFIAPYNTLPRACGDCTVLGSNIKPEFWID